MEKRITDIVCSVPYSNLASFYSNLSMHSYRPTRVLLALEDRPEFITSLIFSIALNGTYQARFIRHSLTESRNVRPLCR